MIKEKTKDNAVKLCYGLSLLEFQCRCSECRAAVISENLLSCYCKLRRKAGVALSINCGHRCQFHNEEVDGVALSQHILGTAIDIAYTNNLKELYTPEEFIALAKECGFTYCYYDKKKNFFHLDCREK